MWVLLGKWRLAAADGLRDEGLQHANHLVHQRDLQRIVESDLMTLVCV